MGLVTSPVAAVRAVLPEAFVAFVINDATDVQAVAHLGRRCTARQRSAMEARGRRCEVPQCTREYGLEIDHMIGWTLTHVTRLDDLAWLCGYHHHEKTFNGWRLTGPPNQRQWVHDPLFAPNPRTHRRRAKRNAATPNDTNPDPPGRSP